MDLIATDAQQLTQEPKVTLFEIDATQYGDTVLRFTPVIGGGANGDVSFGGNLYRSMPIEAQGFEWATGGTAPRPTLSMNALDLVFLSLVTRARDLTGCPVRRIRTYRKYLDDGAQPNPSAHFPIDHYKIEKKTGQNRKALSYELSAGIDQEGKQLPGRQVIRDTCMHRFRYWANGQWNYDGVTCPYAGTAMFEPNGNPTTDPTKAKCGKRLDNCRQHFFTIYGPTAVLPMFAFPGVGRVS